MQVTIQEIIDAAKKNGYEWRGYGQHGIIGDKKFCVLEQTMLNLNPSISKDNVDWTKLQDAFYSTAYKLDSDGIPDFVDIWTYNDQKAESYQDAVENMERVLLEHFSADTSIEILED